MGYNITIESNKKITEEEIREIINAIPDTCKYFNREQNWGWILNCDVYKPNGNKLTLGGGISSMYNIADYLKEHLIKNGHKISIGRVW